tara:strand:+ start:268 stop:441 length:174 start_codon:yes stop_codon:yes gene_type:complete
VIRYVIGDFTSNFDNFCKVIEQYNKKDDAINILNRSKFSRLTLSKIYGTIEKKRKNL